MAILIKERVVPEGQQKKIKGQQVEVEYTDAALGEQDRGRVLYAWAGMHQGMGIFQELQCMLHVSTNSGQPFLQLLGRSGRR